MKISAFGHCWVLRWPWVLAVLAVALLIVRSAWALLVKSTRILAEPTSEQPELRNTLYRKMKRGRRQLTPGRMLVYRIAVVVAWQLIRFFWATCRIHSRPGFERAQAAVSESSSCWSLGSSPYWIWAARSSGSSPRSTASSSLS